MPSAAEIFTVLGVAVGAGVELAAGVAVDGIAVAVSVSICVGVAVAGVLVL